MGDGFNRDGGVSSTPEAQVRTFEGNAECKGGLNKQMRLSILSWNAGTKRGEVTNSMIESFHVIIIEEAETHCNETRTSAEQQCYIYWGANQLVLCCESTFGPEGVKKQEEIPGTSIQDACGLKHLLVKTRFRRPSPLPLRN